MCSELQNKFYVLAQLLLGLGGKQQRRSPGKGKALGTSWLVVFQEK